MARQQAELIEDRGIKELDRAAQLVKEFTDERMAVLKKECEARDSLLALMKKHDRTTYNFDSYEVEIIPGKEKVKVRSQKDTEEEDGDDTI